MIRVSCDRYLNQYKSIFIRSNASISIIDKVLAKSSSFLSEIVSPIDTFGLPSKEKGHADFHEGDLKLLHSVGFNDQGISYIERSRIRKNTDLIRKYKVKISIMVPQGGEVGIKPENGYRSISTPQILGPDTVDTFSYLNVGFFDTYQEAVNYRDYLQCKFTRFLIRTTFSSVHISQGNFIFAPQMDFSRHWTDRELYSFFALTDEEVELIESTMRSMTEPTYYTKLLDSSYEAIVQALNTKYGAARHNYFKDTGCTIKNPLVSRTDEGLYCHHIDEDKAIMLSNDKYAAANPFDYQKATRLVYCNLLEHLLLHVKIAESPSKDANEDELPGIGGAINFICKELNDIYAGKEPADEWRKKVAEKVKDSFEDYISILRYLWNVVESNPLYKAIITKEMLCVGWDGKVVKKVMNALNGND